MILINGKGREVARGERSTGEKCVKEEKKENLYVGACKEKGLSSSMKRKRPGVRKRRRCRLNKAQTKVFWGVFRDSGATQEKGAYFHSKGLHDIWRGEKSVTVNQGRVGKVGRGSPSRRRGEEKRSPFTLQEGTSFWHGGKERGRYIGLMSKGEKLRKEKKRERRLKTLCGRSGRPAAT